MAGWFQNGGGSSIVQAGAGILGNLFTGWMNKRATDRMNEYNTPKNQMKRFKEAGLNPNLVYGQGNPGNQSQPQQVPDYSGIGRESVQTLNQTRMVDSQVSANNAATAQRLAQTELTKVKTAVEANNPLLDKEYLNALISSFQSTAAIKASEADLSKQKRDWSLGEKSWTVDGKQMHGPAGALKLEYELQQLLQRFDLGNQDKAIKAEIVKSKDFQNQILEVQKRFMTDAEVTPQHILQFVQLLLMKML